MFVVHRPGLLDRPLETRCCRLDKILNMTRARYSSARASAATRFAFQLHAVVSLRIRTLATFLYEKKMIIECFFFLFDI